MDMKLTLLILSVTVIFTGGYSEIKVELFPDFPCLHESDEVTLICEDNSKPLKDDVKWYKNQILLSHSSTVYIPAADMTHSGNYSCEHGGKKSSEVEIRVLDMADMVGQGTLTHINPVKSVLSKGDAVLLELYVKDGLKDWWCRYAEDGVENWLHFPEKRTKHSVRIHADVGQKTGRTYWCLNTKMTDDKCQRSNAVKLTTTEIMVMLQMSERPALLGDDVTLTCVVWGTPQVEKTVFYKDGEIIQKTDNKKTYIINNIDENSGGSYRCDATYRFSHISQDAATRHVSSDEQVLLVVGPPVATLNCNNWSCTCEECQKPHILYFTPEGETHVVIIKESDKKRSGTYICRATWRNKVLSRISNTCHYEEPVPPVWVVIGLIILVIVLALLVLFLCKRRQKQAAITDGADGGYEEIGGRKKGEETGGEYELLKLSKKEEDKDQYETLKGAGKGQGEGQYEALKKGNVETEVYHTLKEQGQAQGQGEYEALKKSDAETEVYHTLKEQGQAQGQGEYEALKKSDTETEVYHTLKEQGQAQGQGEYETLKTTQAEVYQTLGQPKVEEAEPTSQDSPSEEQKTE